MCGRYRIDSSERMDEIIDEMMRSPLVEKWQKTVKVCTDGEICPTDVAPVIAPNRAGEKAVFPMKWGFSGKSLLINARVESAAEKPTFQESWKKRRCIVPATYYYEWEHLVANNGKKAVGAKYMIQPRGYVHTWLCGLYRIENGLPVFVILTRDAAENIRFIHERMPLIMPEDMVDAWIRPDADPDELVKAALTDMYSEKAD